MIILLLLFFLTNFQFFSLDFKNQEALYIVFASAIIFVLGIPISVIQRIMYAKQQILKFNLWQISGAFFSLFYENLFSILNSASNLDPFLMEFGSLYEGFRSTYNRHLDSIQDSFPLEFSTPLNLEITSLDR